MPRLPISEQALRLALTRPTATRQSQFVCRACVRQYHPSPILRAELPFWKRITNSLFGSSEQKAATEKRDEAHQQRLQELAEQGGGKTETLVDDKGRTWTIAAVVDPSVNKQYVQAQRWDGLEWVGSKEWIARKNDSGEAYVGFNPRRNLQLDNIQWQRALQHVTVEVLALAQAGRDVSAVYTERPVRVEDWKRTADVNVRVENGAVELQLPKDDTLELILKAVPESLAEEIIMAAENAETVPEPVTEEELAEELVLEELAAEELTQEELSQEELALESAEEGLETATETAAEESAEGLTKQHYVDPKDIDAAEKTTMRELRDAIRATTWKKVKTVGRGKTKQVVQLPPADRGFLQTPLADPAIKLAIIKRVQQLTGMRIRDHTISSASTVDGLFTALKFKPEPKKLFKTKQLQNLHQMLPNVAAHQSRQTPIHKHKQVGRWKVIEEELINRGLPVTGSRYQGAKTTSPIL